MALHPSLGDKPSRYDLRVTNEWGAFLPAAATGDCVYLGLGGCTIYEDRPALCRTFDCRQYAIYAPKEDPLKDTKVIARGRDTS